MPDKEYDPYALSTGLLDDFDLTIESVTFTTDAKIGDGEVLLARIEGRTDDDDSPEWAENYSCGKGWESLDGGVTAQREDGKGKGFNNGSKFGRFITAAIEAGAGATLRERDNKLGPRNSRIWDGMVFHMNATEVNYGGEIGKKNIVLPTEFKGTKGGSVAAPSTPAVDTSDVPGALRAKLTNLASQIKGQGGSHDDFIDQAFQVDGVDGNPAAEAAVVNEGGLWSEAA